MAIPPTQSTQGLITAHAAETLAQVLDPTRFTVYCAHAWTGPTHFALGEIASSSGTDQASALPLGVLDIAVVSPRVGQPGVVWALAEIEESSRDPKRCLGDALAALLGDSITFPGVRPPQAQPLQVGPWTTLMLLLADGDGKGLARKLDFLQREIDRLWHLLRSHQPTPANSAIGRVAVHCFDRSPSASGTEAAARIESEALNNYHQWHRSIGIP